MSHLQKLTPLQRYVRDQFHPEDELLQTIQEGIREHQKPLMNIGPEQGRMLQVLMAAIGAEHVLEIGTFFGYSAVWIGRALPPDGTLLCLEVSREHADIAQGFLDQAGLADQVEVRVGPAIGLLPEIEASAPFDMIFLDADRESYPSYLPWIEAYLRPGGLLVIDNAFAGGRLATANGGENASPGVKGMNTLLTAIALSDRWTGTIMPYEDGLAVAVFEPGK
ncbi:MAG: O-methyltransferase [Chloroflexota bacterium]|nr:O-methyltransferase [Chloroflexota bacterium]